MAEIDWAEKRNALRQRTLKHGRIVVKGVSTMDCLIRNMSLTGARLAIENAHSLPDTFELLIGDEGLRRECEIMSRNDGSAGVRFFKALTPRELGAEFMSTKRSSRAADTAARSTDAGSEAVSAPRIEIGAPPLDQTVGAGESGVPKIKASTLPKPIARNLPWTGRRRARSIAVTY